MATDLLALTAELVDIPSVSGDEAVIVADIERRLEGPGWLELARVGDNLVARTRLGRDQRLLLAGHTDTVPANGNEHAVIEGDTLWGLGSADMKGGLAIMLDLAVTVPEPAVDVTFVFYAREEIAALHSGLLEIYAERPDLLEASAALIGEPTGGTLEAGCQGTMRFEVTLVGRRAHTARPWMGDNAIHRLGRLLEIIDGAEPRRPVIDGCEYREALQAVSIEGGVAGNVVPDEASVVINHRVAPDRTLDQAESWFRDLIAPVLGNGDVITRVEAVPGAMPALGHPLVAAAIERNELEVHAKLGWTDVARFAEHGLPAANMGPGEATLAHTADEHVDRASLEAVRSILLDLVTVGP